MAQWNVKTSTLVILGGLIFLMLLIVVLPDVDLPDAAFQGGTAPVVMHAHATSAPAAIGAGATGPALLSDGTFRFQMQMLGWSVHTPPNFRPILLRSIRC